MGALKKFLSFSCLLLSLVWCLFLRDPHLLFLRDLEKLLLFLMLILSILLSKNINILKLKYSIQIASIVLITLLLYEELNFKWNKYQILNHPTYKQKQINQRLIIGFRDFNEIEKLSLNGISGIFLTKRNIKDKSLNQIKVALKKLQQKRKEAGLPFLIVATDQEGGAVTRLSPLIEKQPPLSSLVGVKNASQKAYAYGCKQGKQLKELGINVNFSPVVDLKPSQAIRILDFHSLIHTRAISNSPKDIIDIALPYIKGLETQGIMATLKHFPGLGKVPSDTHHFSAKLNIPTSELNKNDWEPFKEISKKSDVWIMLAHVILPEIDPLNPVSTSAKVVNEIIRKKLNYNGVLVTDDLTMGATYNRGFCKSVLHSFSADIDYLLIAYDYEKYYSLMNCFKH
jgi:beta-N-acetylhexosaminidase